mmetsp:Transcript_16400/g.40511  ORF Transcript_16400/g.40511 Transcript_16400/m.40511 type:complete len:867 (-) Transcript_16400:531-3131(-)
MHSFHQADPSTPFAGGLASATKNGGPMTGSTQPAHWSPPPSSCCLSPSAPTPSRSPSAPIQSDAEVPEFAELRPRTLDFSQSQGQEGEGPDGAGPAPLSLFGSTAEEDFSDEFQDPHAADLLDVLHVLYYFATAVFSKLKGAALFLFHFHMRGSVRTPWPTASTGETQFLDSDSKGDPVFDKSSGGPVFDSDSEDEIDSEPADESSGTDDDDVDGGANGNYDEDEELSRVSGNLLDQEHRGDGVVEVDAAFTKCVMQVASFLTPLFVKRWYVELCFQYAQHRHNRLFHVPEKQKRKKNKFRISLVVVPLLFLLSCGCVLPLMMRDGGSDLLRSGFDLLHSLSLPAHVTHRHQRSTVGASAASSALGKAGAQFLADVVAALFEDSGAAASREVLQQVSTNTTQATAREVTNASEQTIDETVCGVSRARELLHGLAKRRDQVRGSSEKSARRGNRRGFHGASTLKKFWLPEKLTPQERFLQQFSRGAQTAAEAAEKEIGSEIVQRLIRPEEENSIVAAQGNTTVRDGIPEKPEHDQTQQLAQEQNAPSNPFRIETSASNTTISETPPEAAHSSMESNYLRNETEAEVQGVALVTAEPDRFVSNSSSPAATLSSPPRIKGALPIPDSKSVLDDAGEQSHSELFQHTSDAIRVLPRRPRVRITNEILLNDYFRVVPHHESSITGTSRGRGHDFACRMLARYGGWYRQLRGYEPLLVSPPAEEMLTHSEDNRGGETESETRSKSCFEVDGSAVQIALESKAKRHGFLVSRVELTLRRERDRDLMDDGRAMSSAVPSITVHALADNVRDLGTAKPHSTPAKAHDHYQVTFLNADIPADSARYEPLRRVTLRLHAGGQRTCVYSVRVYGEVAS